LDILYFWDISLGMYNIWTCYIILLCFDYVLMCVGDMFSCVSLMCVADRHKVYVIHYVLFTSCFLCVDII